ncbi:LPS export ABC transporter permease LptG [Candidatus Vallotia tarda]|uniref:LPS export ABC transporter permease LptG n=1 Tax=Candidatus Vallotiella hemipterorum TaxID=1177213 RepID=A0A916JSX7_9BURK|nr:LPS export ABC transporter permease LptG [Candidatus Vallotia tarda]CAG7600494.1 LPS export ABC transporter permease LptG [Candidatus Vallotia tarda]
MRLYERYLAKKVYLTLSLLLFAFSGLFFFFDLINELHFIGRGNYKFLYAVLRAVLQIPSRFYEIIPIATLISAIYVFTQMSTSSEFTIFRVSGLSAPYALRSLVKIGWPIVILTFIFGEVVGPYADQLSEHISLEVPRTSISSNFQSGVWAKDTLFCNGTTKKVTRFVNVGELKPDETISNVRIFEFDAQFHLTSIRTADIGLYVRPGQWLLKGVTEVRLYQLALTDTMVKDSLNPVYKSSLILMPEYKMRSELTPQILSALLVSPDRMSIMHLFSYVQHLHANHQNAQRYMIVLWKKLLYPFAVLVMLALSLPFAYLHTRAGSVNTKMFGGIMVGMSFQLFNTLFSHIGTLNAWPAPLTAATPSLVYLVIGLLALLWVNCH